MEKLKRYDLATTSWVDVASVNRIEVLQGDSYVYPSEWPTVSDCPLNHARVLIKFPEAYDALDGIEGKISINMALYANGRIDWGDGIIENWNMYDVVTISHTYVRGTGTLDTKRDYETFLIDVTTQDTLTYSILDVVGVNQKQLVLAYCSNASTRTFPFFDDCTNLEYFNMLGVSAGGDNLYVSGVLSMANCANLQYLNFAQRTYLGILNLTGCKKLKSVDCTLLGNSDLHYAPNELTLKLDGCSALSKLTLASVKIPFIPYLFRGCTSLSAMLDLSATTFKAGDATGMFYDCVQLYSVKINLSLATKIEMLFYNCKNLAKFDFVGNLSKVTSASQFLYLTRIRTFDFTAANMVELLNVTNMFSSTLLTVIDISVCNKINTTMQSAFSNLVAITDITLPTAPLASITMVGGMFSGCTSLVTVNNLGKYKYVTEASNLFDGCTKLASIDMGDFGLLSASSINLYYAFRNCTSLLTINLSKVTKLTHVNYTFDGCTKLETVEFGIVDFPLVTNMSYTFRGCIALTALNLNLFKNVTLAPYMLYMATRGVPLTLTSNLFAANAASVDMNYALENANIYDINLSSAKLTRIGLLSTHTTPRKTLDSFVCHVNSTFSLAPPSGYHLDLRSTSLTDVQLNTLFTNLPTVTSKSIYIGGCVGAATCNRAIATAKGWTVTG